MPKFPIDAPKSRVIKALKRLGFELVKEREHIAMVKENSDGTKTPFTMPNHPTLKSSTLRTICTQTITQTFHGHYSFVMFVLLIDILLFH